MNFDELSLILGNFPFLFQLTARTTIKKIKPAVHLRWVSATAIAIKASSTNNRNLNILMINIHNL